MGATPQTMAGLAACRPALQLAVLLVCILLGPALPAHAEPGGTAAAPATAKAKPTKTAFIADVCERLPL